MIYKKLIHCDLRDAQNEKNKNIVLRIIAFTLYISSIILYFQIYRTFRRPSEAILFIPGVLFFIGIIFNAIKNTTKYKENVIRNFIYFLNPNINYTEPKLKNKDFQMYGKARHTSPLAYDNFEHISSLLYNIYDNAKFSDSGPHQKHTSTDLITYELNDGSCVTLEDLEVRTTGRHSSEVFNGIICEISRKKYFLQTFLLKEINYSKLKTE